MNHIHAAMGVFVMGSSVFLAYAILIDQMSLFTVKLFAIGFFIQSLMIGKPWRWFQDE